MPLVLSNRVLSNTVLSNRFARSIALMGAISLCIAAPAHAHEGDAMAGGLLSGLRHPIVGLDHVIAMIAVGLWGTQLKKPAIWLLPVTFPIVMAFGGVLGIRGVPLPGVEIGIALSGVTLGLLIALAARPPLWVACAIVGVFAIFHGYAHGRELPDAASPVAYGVGFVVATGGLHLAGIALGLIESVPRGAGIVRASGAGIALAGAYFLVTMITAS